MSDIATGKHLAKDMFDALGLGDIKWVTDFTLKVEDGVLLVQLEKVVLVEQIPPLLRVLQKYRFTPSLESEEEAPPSSKAADLLAPPCTPADLAELLRHLESKKQAEALAMETTPQAPSL